jgi:hypothetical protein
MCRGKISEKKENSTNSCSNDLWFSDRYQERKESQMFPAARLKYLLLLKDDTSKKKHGWEIYDSARIGKK